MLNKNKSDKKNKQQKEIDIYSASHSELIWMNFKKHRLAMTALGILIVIYIVSIFCGFFSPMDPQAYSQRRTYQPPQRIRFFDEEGFNLRPFVYGYQGSRDMETLRRVYKVDKSQKYPIQFFTHGYQYKLLGLFETDIHLFGTEDGYIHLLGTDSMGRDVLSRILYGGRISTSIGFIGVIISFVLGITIGGIAGLYGGIIDNIIQRIIELIRSIPKIPLWMGLSAALPSTWSPLKVYAGIVAILALIAWTGLARIVRSKFLSLKNEDFVVLARLSGASESRIIIKHMVPAFLSHIIASLTLNIPQMIISETSLSFLGIGLRPPVVSWGVLLQSAQSINTVALAPWLLFPGVAVIITVLAFNFVGDGLRDAADLYGGR